MVEESCYAMKNALQTGRDDYNANIIFQVAESEMFRSSHSI